MDIYGQDLFRNMICLSAFILLKTKAELLGLVDKTFLEEQVFPVT